MPYLLASFCWGGILAHLIFKLKHCSSSRFQVPLTQSCSHVVTRTRFCVQIIACSICSASVGMHGVLTVRK